MKKAPRQVNDGNWLIEAQVGCDVHSTPFSLKGDNRTMEIKRTMRIDVRAYKRLPTMWRIITPKGQLYLVEEGDTRHVGNGIVEWDRTFSSIPERRVEPSQIGYTRQEFTGTQIVEFTETVPCEIVWQYGLKPFPTLLAPKIIPFAGTFMTFGGFGVAPFIPGRQYLAEDSENGIYKGGIYYRRSTLITWKVLKQLN